jgi:hypothetical protein
VTGGNKGTAHGGALTSVPTRHELAGKGESRRQGARGEGGPSLSGLEGKLRTGGRRIALRWGRAVFPGSCRRRARSARYNSRSCPVGKKRCTDATSANISRPARVEATGGRGRIAGARCCFLEAIGVLKAYGCKSAWPDPLVRRVMRATRYAGYVGDAGYAGDVGDD